MKGGERMNANAMMNFFAPVTTSNTVTVPKQGNGNLTSGDPFSNILSQQLSAELISEDLLIPQEEQGEISLSEWLQSLAGVRIEEELEDLLENGSVEKLISILPVEWKDEIMAWINNLSDGGGLTISSDAVERMVKEWPEEQLAVIGVLLSQFIETQGTAKVPDIIPFDKVLPQVMADTPKEPNISRIERFLEGMERALSQQKAQAPADEVIKAAINRLFTEKPDVTHTFASLAADKQPPLTILPLHSGVMFNPLMSRTEQAVIHLGDQQPKEVQQQQLLRQFEQIMQRGIFRTNEAGMNTFSIRLFPAHLGRLDVQLTQIEGVLVARLLTSSSAAKELVESQLHHLRQAFNSQQINVERVEVFSQNQSSIKDDQSSNKERPHDDREQQKETQQAEEDDTFRAFLDEITFNEEV